MTLESTDLKSISEIDYYRLIRGLIEHEDNLLSQRLSWFLMSQSFLMTAYTIALTNFPGDPNLPWAHQRSLLLSLLPVLAITSSVVIILAILAGVFAMKRLRRGYEDRYKLQPAVVAELGLPPMQGSKGTLAIGLLGLMLVPCIFTVAWFLLMFNK